MELNNNLKAIYTQEDIIKGMSTVFDEVNNVILTVDDLDFNKNPGNGKWSIAENLEHLIVSAKPVASALKLPKLTFKALGTPNRPTRDFEGLVHKYQAVLENGGKAGGKFVPKENQNYDKTVLLENWSTIGKKFEKRIAKWSEKDLDAYLMPHPLIGKLMVREMLFFTIYHTWHHLEIIKKLKN